jgi:hypothetical protein
MEIEMRHSFHTVVPSAVTLIGLVSELCAPASAGEIDPASAVRGSLGASLDELAFGNGAGPSVFLLNAGFALLFGAVALRARRRKSPRSGHIQYKRTSYFTR